MELEARIRELVHTYYWEHDLNCATCTLLILAQEFDVELHAQVLDAALGMHGAGGARAQCGLVEGGLMFLGVLGRARGISDEDIVDACRRYGTQFATRFGSLSCAVLRPEGFHPDNPPHLCERLTREAISFDARFVEDWLSRQPTRTSRTAPPPVLAIVARCTRRSVPPGA